MIAQTIDNVWRENVDAARSFWKRLAHSESAGMAHSASAARWRSRLLSGAVAVVVVLALTYSAASALVSGAASSSAARNDYLLVLQAASAHYRLARAECMAKPSDRRENCIAEAHANETRLRNVASLAPSKHLAVLRSQSSNVLVNAEAQDSIVIEPACNVVARGNASVCEIQVRGSVIEANNTTPGVSYRQSAFADSKSSAKGGTMTTLAHWLHGSRNDRDRYNVVAVISP